MNRLALFSFLVPLCFAILMLTLRDGNIDKVTLPEKSKLSNIDNNYINGRANVIDGDTISIDEIKIRLHAIDAPESRQYCRSDSDYYRCGQEATQFLGRMIGDKQVTCVSRGRDRYGRIIATCDVEGRDIGAQMVANGWALAYRRFDSIYVAHEIEARRTGVGLWVGEFVEPWDWRRGQRLKGEENVQ